MGKFIVSVETKNKPNIHGTEMFHWIIAIDSLVNFNDFKIYPLYLKDFSKDKVDGCLQGKKVDVFTASTSSDYSFTDKYKKDLIELERVLLSNRKKVQKITKKWHRGKRQTATVYLTSILGNFCFCKTGDRERMYLNHSGTISLPLGGFKANDSLWLKEKGKEVLYIDFSKYTFSNKQ